MKEFSCKDIYPECDFKTSGKDENEVLEKAAQHGKEKHGLNELTDEQKNKVRGLIRDKKEAA